eukprot:XP_019929713.1 PREDICTED: E3 ubiquitin-protein ligase mib1-like [Crassostrea gigas]
MEFATIITHIIVLILGFLFGIFSIRQPFQRKTHSDHEDEALFVGDDRCCPICYDRNRSIAFQCGHTFCSQCSDQLTDCPNCRVKFTDGRTDGRTDRQTDGRRQKADHEDEALIVGDDRCCPICFDKNNSIAFQCGHTFCSQCSDQLTDCPNCRVRVTQRLRLFS